MNLSHATTILSAGVWRERACAHRARAEVFTLPARYRRDRGQPHPIADFLFEYYPFGFSLLEQWQPGIGMGIEWDGPASVDELPAPFSGRRYALKNGVLEAAPGGLSAKEVQRLAWILELLIATRDRLPNFACHGLHEWAMVYRGREVRHEKTLRLRLPQREIDAVVETQVICCSHHDAFRFFHGDARPLNHLQPSLENRISLEQPACLHANMDLYKWTAKAMPWAGSGLLLDCFELAMELRNLDMRASPYDLSDWGLEAVPIETADGRRTYETLQKSLAARARPLRERLIDSIGQTLSVTGNSTSELDLCQSMV